MTFHVTNAVRSWGGVLQTTHRVASPTWIDEMPSVLANARNAGMSLLAVGLRRSYGDSGLNPAGSLIDMTGLDRIVSFDPSSRILEAEAGVSFSTILRLILPHGLFMPVTPGTRFVTLGGAIANDVHGKNHHGHGSLGRWVRRIQLLRTDGTETTLTPADPTGLFSATIGGMGLTGIITRAEIELMPVASTLMDSETVPFGNLADFFAVARDSEAGFAYTVAWIDCFARGAELGRGHFVRGNHSAQGFGMPRLGEPRLRIPFAFPDVVLNRNSVGAFNALYHRLKGKQRRAKVPLAPFFFPLDGVANWNLIYGRRGLYQFQSVVPVAAQEDATRDMLAAISASGQGSFLAVLKTFGSLASPGLLSFPRQGTTLALDFPNQGEVTLKLMSQLDDIVLAAGGRLYPAKDGRMPAHMFKAGYANWEDFARHVDPGMGSSFWSRVTNG